VHVAGRPRRAVKQTVCELVLFPCFAIEWIVVPAERFLSAVGGDAVDDQCCFTNEYYGYFRGTARREFFCPIAESAMGLVLLGSPAGQCPLDGRPAVPRRSTVLRTRGRGA